MFYIALMACRGYVSHVTGSRTLDVGLLLVVMRLSLLDDVRLEPFRDKINALLALTVM